MMTIAGKSHQPGAHDVMPLLQQGLAFQQHGQLDQAKTLYEQVLAIDAKNFDALNLLGVIAAQQGDLERAAKLMGLALEISPNRAPLHFNRGAVLQQLQRTEEAMASFQRAIDIKPDFAEAHFNLGIALRSLNRAEEALDCFQRTIAIQPSSAEAHFHLGDVLQECKRTAEALASFDLAIAIQPGFAEAHMQRGNVLQECKRAEEALSSYDRAIAMMPDFAEAHFNRGVVLHERQRMEEALASYDRALAIEHGYAAAHCNRGIALHLLLRGEEALASFDRAISIKPNYAAAFCNRGIALDRLKRSEEALVSFDRAIAISPDYAEAFWNKSLTYLSLGNFEEGWPLYEWRWKRTDDVTFDARRHEFQPPWLGGQPLAGKTICLHAEQGLGDTIQFCRYTKLVKAMGATVILEVPRPLKKLLSGLEGVDQVIELGSPVPDFDFHCPLMSLPLAFKTRLDTLPSSMRYLHAQSNKVGHWQQRLGVATRLRVGLVWSGGFRPDQPEIWAVNQRRNLPFELLGLFKGVDVDFISLQKGEPAESEFAAAISAGWAGPTIADYSAELRDFADTAALIENLDLVISVDTSVAHLAAALGKPVWILNRFDSCWRWLQNRTDSPWYPTVKLYNQECPGDWELVMRRVRQDLFDLGA